MDISKYKKCPDKDHFNELYKETAEAVDSLLYIINSTEKIKSEIVKAYFVLIRKGERLFDPDSQNKYQDVLIRGVIKILRTKNSYNSAKDEYDSVYNRLMKKADLAKREMNSISWLLASPKNKVRVWNVYEELERMTSLPSYEEIGRVRTSYYRVINDCDVGNPWKYLHEDRERLFRELKDIVDDDKIEEYLRLEERQEAERQRAEKEERERQEAERQRAEKEERERQDAERQRAEKEEREKQEAERQRAEKEEREKQEETTVSAAGSTESKSQWEIFTSNSKYVPPTFGNQSDNSDVEEEREQNEGENSHVFENDEQKREGEDEDTEELSWMRDSVILQRILDEVRNRQDAEQLALEEDEVQKLKEARLRVEVEKKNIEINEQLIRDEERKKREDKQKELEARIKHAKEIKKQKEDKERVQKEAQEWLKHEMDERLKEEKGWKEKDEISCWVRDSVILQRIEDQVRKRLEENQKTSGNEGGNIWDVRLKEIERKQQEENETYLYEILRKKTERKVRKNSSAELRKQEYDRYEEVRKQKAERLNLKDETQRIKESAQEIHSHSWKVLPGKAAIKIIDKSAVDYNGSGVPLDICFFFHADKLEPGDQIPIQLFYNGIIFTGKITRESKMSGVKSPRVRIYWDPKLKFEISKHFANAGENKIPVIRFTPTNMIYEYNFSLDIISSDIPLSRPKNTHEVKKTDEESVHNGSVSTIQKTTVKKRRVTIDKTKLEKVLSESDDIQKMLKVDYGEEEVISIKQSSIENKSEADAVSTDGLTDWDLFKARATKNQLAFMELMLHSSDKKSELKKIAADDGKLFDVFIEDINNLANDCTGDVVIDDNCILDDYKDSVAALFR